ncbi:MAG: hypothetical protein ACOH10_08095 [Rhodoglobus sp.]
MNTIPSPADFWPPTVSPIDAAVAAFDRATVARILAAPPVRSFDQIAARPDSRVTDGGVFR